MDIFANAPWTFRPTFFDDGKSKVWDNSGALVADPSGRTGEFREATGHAIAALPELVASCDAWLKHYDGCVRQEQLGDEPGIAEMRAALAKIKGTK